MRGFGLPLSGLRRAGACEPDTAGTTAETGRFPFLLRFVRLRSRYVASARRPLRASGIPSARRRRA